MKAPLFLFVSITTFICARAQSTWNAFEYKVPPAYKTVDIINRLLLEKFAGKQYCQLVIFPLEQTSADAAGSFKAHWKFFARNAEQGVGEPETTEEEMHDGWRYTFGAARGSYKGQMFAITLSSRYKEGHTYFVATVFSDKQFLEDAQTFINSVSLSPAASAKLKPVSSGQAPGNKPAGTAGWVSTRFDDGWTSTYVGPYVTVSKDDLLAWIFPVNDSLDLAEVKPNQVLEDKYWRYAVDQFFETRNVAERPWQMSGPGSDKIFEAEVKNKQTGEERFVAMRLIWNSGSVQTVLAFAPTKEQMYKSAFAQYSSFEEVLAYNKFIPDKKVLQGTWQSVETGSTGSYSIAGGFQGGNSKVRFTDEFTFYGDGTYQSRQAVQRNASLSGDGMARSYKGSFTINGETLQLTGRDKEDPGEFECWMEATQNGLALVLVNKKFTGQRYRLYKSR